MKPNPLFCSLAFAVALYPLAGHAGCTLYEHRDYGGASWGMSNGETLKMVEGESFGVTTNGHCPSCEGNTYFEPSWNDSVSSFQVTRGCRVTLWEHVNQGGAQFGPARSHSYVGSDWNDEASEARCTCR